jgi:two-component system, chemotaxis family, protein-glutamate methylesterase/glutaminase
MPRDVIVIGGSTGSVEALCQFVRGLPAGFNAAVFVVCHIPSTSPSALPDILSRRGQVLARHPRDGEPAHPGHIYVAPPDLHLTLRDGLIRLDHGPRENRFRPAIDPLFRSAAREYGGRVIGVILSGSLNDGVAGLIAVRSAGGLTVVQDPADAILAELPRSAIQVAGADHVAAAADLASLIIRLVPDAPVEGTPMNDPMERIAQKQEQDLANQSRDGHPGALTTYTCPECGGNLWQVDEQKVLRFRCHVGHSYAGEALLADASSVLEAALWTAVRMFREKAVLSRQLAEQASQAGDADRAERFGEAAAVADRQGEVIRRCLAVNGGEPVPKEPA